MRSPVLTAAETLPGENGVVQEAVEKIELCLVREKGCYVVPVLHTAISLRASYKMPSTDTVYGARRG